MIYVVVEERGSRKREIIEVADDSVDVVLLARARRVELIGVAETRSAAELVLGRTGNAVKDTDAPPRAYPLKS